MSRLSGIISSAASVFGFQSQGAVDINSDYNNELHDDTIEFSSDNNAAFAGDLPDEFPLPLDSQTLAHADQASWFILPVGPPVVMFKPLRLDKRIVVEFEIGLPNEVNYEDVLTAYCADSLEFPSRIEAPTIFYRLRIVDLLAESPRVALGASQIFKDISGSVGKSRLYDYDHVDLTFGANFYLRRCPAKLWEPLPASIKRVRKAIAAVVIDVRLIYVQQDGRIAYHDATTQPCVLAFGPSAAADKNNDKKNASSFNEDEEMSDLVENVEESIVDDDRVDEAQPKATKAMGRKTGRGKVDRMTKKACARHVEEAKLPPLETANVTFAVPSEFQGTSGVKIELSNAQTGVVARFPVPTTTRVALGEHRFHYIVRGVECTIYAEGVQRFVDVETGSSYNTLVVEALRDACITSVRNLHALTRSELATLLRHALPDRVECIVVSSPRLAAQTTHVLNAIARTLVATPSATVQLHWADRSAAKASNGPCAPFSWQTGALGCDIRALPQCSAFSVTHHYNLPLQNPSYALDLVASGRADTDDANKATRPVLMLVLSVSSPTLASECAQLSSLQRLAQARGFGTRWVALDANENDDTSKTYAALRNTIGADKLDFAERDFWSLPRSLLNDSMARDDDTARRLLATMALVVQRAYNE